MAFVPNAALKYLMVLRSVLHVDKQFQAMEKNK